MSYSKIAGGELTGVEIASLSGKLEDDTHGVINTPMAFAGIVDWMGGAGSSISGLLKQIDGSIPKNFYSDGKYKFGVMGETSLPEDLFGNEWDSRIINPDNLGKAAFANLATQIVLLAILGFCARLVAPHLMRVGVSAVTGLNRRAYNAKLMSEVEQIGDLMAAPNMGSNAKMQVALHKHIQGMYDNDSDSLAQALKVLAKSK